MNTETIFRINVSSRGGTQKRFEIRPAKGHDPRVVADLYNCVLDKFLEAGLAIKPEHIETRLSHDPKSVHLGFIDDSPVSLINVVKLSLKSIEEIPRTHQKLTDNENFSSTDPDNGNMWFCPWVVVSSDFRGYKTVVEEIPRSLGQLHVLTVRKEALRHGHVDRLFAYSRPAGLKKFLESKLEDEIEFRPDPEKENAHMQMTRNAQSLFTNSIGVYQSTSTPKVQYLLTMQDYWNQVDVDGRKKDPVFEFHARNGAHYVPELVMPYGQIYDGSSLAYRTLLEYPV